MKLSIARQLTMMTIMTIAILFSVGFVGYNVARSLGTVVESSEKITIPALQAIATMSQTFLELRIAELGHISTWSEEEKAALDKRILELKKTFESSLAEYEKLAADDKDKQLLAADRKAYKAYIDSQNLVLEQSRNTQNTDAKEILTKGAPIIRGLELSLSEHTKYSKKLSSEHTEIANKAASQGMLFTIVSIVLGMLVLGGASFVLNRSIGNRLATMEQTVTQVEANLDLTMRVPANQHDEIGKMAAALNRLLERLQSNLCSVAQAAGDVFISAQNMSSASSRVASSSNLQSSAAADMAANMEELTVSINHVGDQATSARERVSHAGRMASDGGKIVMQTVDDIDAIASLVGTSAELLNRLEQQSQQINTVVNVIKDVADQTNLLALNAAIEAARAGEQGRGFAVVADEVRKLAERTRNSTHEITQTVVVMRSSVQEASNSMRNAVQQVDSSVSRASGAGDMIRQIGEGAHQAVDIVAEITDAILEQSTASTSVAQAVERIAQMAEQNTEEANSSAKTAERLNSLAEELKGITNQYKL